MNAAEDVSFQVRVCVCGVRIHSLAPTERAFVAATDPDDRAFMRAALPVGAYARAAHFEREALHHGAVSVQPSPDGADVRIILYRVVTPDDQAPADPEDGVMGTVLVSVARQDWENHAPRLLAPALRLAREYGMRRTGDVIERLGPVRLSVEGHPATGGAEADFAALLGTLEPGVRAAKTGLWGIDCTVVEAGFQGFLGRQGGILDAPAKAAATDAAAAVATGACPRTALRQAAQATGADSLVRGIDRLERPDSRVGADADMVMALEALGACARGSMVQEALRREARPPVAALMARASAATLDLLSRGVWTTDAARRESWFFPDTTVPAIHAAATRAGGQGGMVRRLLHPEARRRIPSVQQPSAMAGGVRCA